ncbi:MAG: phosphoglucosamine mutase, partial [Cephaloticoccus sp.]|nr:phosphoglucosamine mutase [Cephaloticoccus sp.]
VLPTPAVSRAVKHSGADLGVVITASHNPASDNGIKFFGPGGLKLTDADELAIEQHLGAAMAHIDLPPKDTSTATADYIGAMTELLPGKSLVGWKIVLDTANGATVSTSPVVLRALGAEVVALGDAPDGHNINAGVGSEFPLILSETVLKTGAKLGIAHDGDGDRCVLCDELGGVLDGDEILTILAVHALKQNRLPGKTLVITVQSNLGVDAALSVHGGKVLRTAVGDRYVIEQMLATGVTLGGESSGHIICADVATTGDGLVAALKVMEVMLATGLALSELRKCLHKFPQLTAGLRVAEKRNLTSCPSLTATIHALEAELGARGRVLVRYSGTEAKLRLLVEGPSQAIIEGAMSRLDFAARTDLVVL